MIAFVQVADGTSISEAKSNITTRLATIAPAAKAQDRVGASLFPARRASRLDVLTATAAQ